MVTCIIRPITVSDEPCWVFHQQTGPTVFFFAFWFIQSHQCQNGNTLSCPHTAITHCQNELFYPPFNPLSPHVFTAQLASVLGWGCLQQINISTHVSGPSTHCTGWKLLQSFLWRKEMMPNQPRENGMAQNNEVIEERWEGESLPLWLLAWTSHWWPLAWRPHSTAQHSPHPQAWMWPHSAPEYPNPPTIPCAYTPHLCDFFFFLFFTVAVVPLYGPFTSWLTECCPLPKGQSDPLHAL